MKYISTIVLVLLIMVLVSLIVWKHKKDEDSSLLFKTVQPCITNIEDKRLIPGHLYPLKEIEIKSSISGTFEKAYVQIGSRVKAGDIIAQVKRVPSPADMEIAIRNLSTTKINLDNDEKTYQRYKKLFDTKVIAEVDYENFHKIYDLSREQYLSAQNQLTLLQDGYVKNRIISNMVKATTSGTVIDLPLKEGSSITERNNFNDGTTIAVIARLDSFIFKGKVNEIDLAYLRLGMVLNLHFNAYKISQRIARLNKIAAKGVEEQGVMKYYIEARFGMAGDTLPIRTGYSANAEIILQKRQNILAIEEKSLQFRNDSIYVEVLNSENKFETRYVTTGLSDGVKIEIVKGIKKNDKIKVIE